MWLKFHEAARTIGLACVLALTAMSSAQDVRSNSMPGVDFSKFHTYKWVSIPGGAHPNQIVNQEIMQAVDSQLQGKGLTKTATKQICMWGTRSRSISRSNGMLTAWAAGVFGAWERQRVRPSISDPLS
jgi:hypothetical protein